MWGGGGGTTTAAGGDDMGTSSPVTGEAASLQEILQREKLQFEEKLERAARRRRWLAGE